MVLVDTSVWVDHFRYTEPRLQVLLDAGDVLMHPWVIAELACGNLKDRRLVLGLLHDLPCARGVTQEELYYFIEHHKLFGHGVGVVDIHLLASSLLAGVPLWTKDIPLQRIAQRLSGFPAT